MRETLFRVVKFLPASLGALPEPSEAGPVGREGAAERPLLANCGGRRDAKLVPTTKGGGSRAAPWQVWAAPNK